jgi:hypothetical protein
MFMTIRHILLALSNLMDVKHHQMEVEQFIYWATYVVYVDRDFTVTLSI